MSLKEKLKASNGLPDVAQYVVEAGPQNASQAAAIFREHGFVVLKNALDDQQVSRLLSGCQQEAAKIANLDPVRVGNRGGGRYSMGEAQKVGHLLHNEGWAMLVDLDPVTPVLRQIFKGDDYVCAGAGGDYVLDGVQQYQNLHSDINAPGCYDREDPPVVTVNITLGPLTWENGPTRIIPGTHLLSGRARLGMWEPPSEDHEQEAWKVFTLCPLPAGCAIVRDNRTWHGGTPNLSREPRYLPNCEFAAAWWCKGKATSTKRNQWVMGTPCMPRHVYEGLSPFAQHLSRFVVTDGYVDTCVRDDFGCDYLQPDMLQQLRSADPAVQHQLRMLMSAGTQDHEDGSNVATTDDGKVASETAMSDVTAATVSHSSEEAGPASKAHATYFGLHRDWCDYVTFCSDGSLCVRGDISRVGTWSCQPGHGAQLDLRMAWCDGSDDLLSSADNGVSFTAAESGLSSLTRCGPKSLPDLARPCMEQHVQRNAANPSVNAFSSTVTRSRTRSSLVGCMSIVAGFVLGSRVSRRCLGEAAGEQRRVPIRGSPLSCCARAGIQPPFDGHHLAAGIPLGRLVVQLL